jgi:hypothetical protein
VHVCERSVVLFEQLEKNDISVVFQSIPFFSLDGDDPLRDSQISRYVVPCIELVSHFLALLARRQDLVALDLKDEEKISNVVNSNFNLQHLFDRTIHKDLSIADRLMLAYRLSEYMFLYLKEMRPEVVVFGIVPHHPWDFLFFKICAEMEIPVYFCLCYPFTGNNCFIYDSFFNLVKPDLPNSSDRAESSRALWLNVCKQLFLKLGSLPKGSKAKTTPMQQLYAQDKFNVVSLGLDHVLNFSASVNGVGQGECDSYVMFALHYEPELATNPLGLKYWEQRLAINALRHALPKNVLLVLKEHPYWSSVSKSEYLMHRSNTFFEGVTSVGPVAYVDSNYPLSSYFNSCLALATLSGSAPIEGLAMGIPSFVMGVSPYVGLPGIISSLQDAVTQIKIARSELSQINPLDIVRIVIDQTWPVAPYGLSSEIVKLESCDSLRNSHSMAICLSSLARRSSNTV